jgi:guanosine-3',5'-bis(diphosphate) 3'-pyrophosphohydrolase
MSTSAYADAGYIAPLLGQLTALVSEYDPEADIGLIERAAAFAADRHAGQLRRSGEPFVSHPLAVAQICAQLRQPAPVVAAALLHDVAEDTETTTEEIAGEFGPDVAAMVDGVTKLSRIHFASREEAQAETYRKMILSIGRGRYEVIYIKLADRLHNMRTLRALPKPKQVKTATETLEIYAPLAHHLGIHQIKWELEDIAFHTLHPRRYDEIAAMVAERKHDRDALVEEAGRELTARLAELGITADIRGRAKHVYSIYVKMVKRGKEFNEIFDLTAMRVVVDDIQACYGAIGIIHSLWKPMPGRFKDYVAMAKANGYQSLHTTVIGPRGTPLEIQVRTPRMHEVAELGSAAHHRYKQGKPGAGAELNSMQRVLEAASDADGARDFRGDLLSDMPPDDDIYVFTPRGEVKALPAGSTPLDFAYAVHTDVGHRCVGAKINGRIVPLHYKLKSGEFVEVLTSKAERGPSRDWLAIVRTSRARNKIRHWFAREQRDDLEQKGRDSLAQALKSHGLPHQKLQASPLLAQVLREMGFKKADEFYVAIGGGKVLPGQVANKILQRLKTTTAHEQDVSVTPTVPMGPSRAPSRTSGQYGVVVEGVNDPAVLVRMAKCCTPVPGDDITGYISVGHGITVHRIDCPNARALMRTPERFCKVDWDGSSPSQSFRVEVGLTGWDRPRLLEDIARTFAEFGANIVKYGGQVQDQMARNWYVVEVGDTRVLKSLIAALKNVDAVFDAYRVTPRAIREAEEEDAGVVENEIADEVPDGDDEGADMAQAVADEAPDEVADEA